MSGRDSVRDAERVVVVTCRQLLIDDPRLAARLSQFLRAGASLEEATRALGRTDLVPRQREYAIDELQPEIRSEAERLPEGGWSEVRPWKGRSMIFQVVSREERTRGTIPRLGAGLDAAETDRLAQRAAAAQRAQSSQQIAESSEYQPAVVTEQAIPEYPGSLTEPGTVVVEVVIGVTDTPTSTRVLESSNRLFDQAAISAAQHSKYRSAKRRGIPEQATLTLTFNFVAPQPSDAGTPRQD
jgi:TonB family protein